MTDEIPPCDWCNTPLRDTPEDDSYGVTEDGVMHGECVFAHRMDRSGGCEWY